MPVHDRQREYRLLVAVCVRVGEDLCRCAVHASAVRAAAQSVSVRRSVRTPLQRKRLAAARRLVRQETGRE
jgi:xanthine dehydrogenase iron-sulfur cluster and FAD-binding subunit A